MPKLHLKFQLTRAFYLSLVLILGFVGLTIQVVEERVTTFDTTLIQTIQGLETQVLTWIMKFFTIIGSTASVVVLTALILWYMISVMKSRREALLFLAVVAGAAAFNQILKLTFDRPRPDLYRLVEASGYSFPSGHSMTSFAMYGVLAFLLWRQSQSKGGRTLILLTMLAMTFLIGISRVYLGVHYPSDIIGGYLAGGFWLLVSIWVYQQKTSRA